MNTNYRVRYLDHRGEQETTVTAHSAEAAADEVCQYDNGDGDWREVLDVEAA